MAYYTYAAWAFHCANFTHTKEEREPSDHFESRNNSRETQPRKQPWDRAREARRRHQGRTTEVGEDGSRQPTQEIEKKEDLDRRGGNGHEEPGQALQAQQNPAKIREKKEPKLKPMEETQKKKKKTIWENVHF